MMDVSSLSVFAAVATFFVLPVLSYLIVRRDQKIDAAEVKLHSMEISQVRTEGEVKSLQAVAAMVRDNITRAEFENAMDGVKQGLKDIKERLDREG
jgi:hypothetical protein